ncbi:OmpA family protein [uncultured Eudoraea sp.]|uniref:OmpA family protein n=1 Tax=uncultured Eudoraea sp. TaxID=1035614 RepID=UPI00261E5641|nr:OmpA family protein [uncultured Eudoraea sp.]
MKSYTTSALAVLFFGTYAFYAQEEIQSTQQEQLVLDQQEELQLTAKDSMVVSSWMVGLGWNFVNDSGDRLNNITKIKGYYNSVAFPSRISIGRYFKSGIGLEAITSYNNYKKGKIIDGVVNPEDKDYFGFDTRFSYDLNKIVGQTGWFDPYVGVGAGYTYANDLGRGTYNAVIGFRTWFSDRWGLDFSSSGKWSFGNEASNHIQHAVGVVYQFNIEKELTKKGLEKLALINAMEEEAKRVSDSINAALEAEAAAAALAERLAREKEEAARLAAENKANQEAIDLQKQKMDELSNLNKVFFRFDSSYLTVSDQGILDELVAFMNKYPDVIIEVKGHADSRGKADYNQWLSQRRADSAVKHIVDSGIDSNRIYGTGYGELQISNGCTDGVRCTKEEHKQNRITEYSMVEESENVISLNK